MGIKTGLNSTHVGVSGIVNHATQKYLSLLTTNVQADVNVHVFISKERTRQQVFCLP